jgi:hypothetical protein
MRRLQNDYLIAAALPGSGEAAHVRPAIRGDLTDQSDIFSSWIDPW